MNASTCYNLDDLVNIDVTSPSGTCKTYTLPRGLLQWHSAYFAASLSSDNGFMEGGTGRKNLEEDSEVFDAFYCWLFTGKLKDDTIKHENCSIEDLYLSERTLCRIWVFADMRGIPALGNAAIDMLHEQVATKWSLPSVELMQQTYEQTRSGSELRKYLVDLLTMTRSSKGLQKELQGGEYPYEFVLEALPKMVRKGKNDRMTDQTAWTKLDRCQWHIHSGAGGKLRPGSSR